MSALIWLGRHASALLVLGFVVVPFLPFGADQLRPALPWLVVLVTALGTARQPTDRATLARVFAPRATLAMAGWLALSQVGLALLVVMLGHALHAPPELLVLIVAFCAASPLSSAPNLALMLGYDFTLALRLTLLGTLLAPVLMPLALAVSGLSFDAPVGQVAVKVLGMLAGGIVLGLGIQRLCGQDRIARNPEILNGLAALAMISFLFPLLAGSRAAVAADPVLGAELLALALLLNFGGHLLVRALARPLLPPPAARALGLVFGNRNVSIVLASLPFDPTLTLFVAALQCPVYATPVVFGLAARLRNRTAPSS
ncbi:hypothetical protein KM176_00105 [Pseudooceanicola sp. CBS1P-1]|uniref:Bile acid:sodium symporter n=1 Tax=Pseudooceanicola albus TaxID=2692189 RepID=A0A6L7FZR3_9RHOB|nr:MULTISPECIES: hypothetical protein [Pseudooceanicola]MBT9382247.1 hypothetical protein [Pseudooceanicola endophyticus]MXN16790.1 hypothetical protein [Pseudooceanicola albus]